MITERNIALLFAAWGILCFVAVVISTTITKNRIPNPYQDSRALEFGTKPMGDLQAARLTGAKIMNLIGWIGWVLFGVTLVGGGWYMFRFFWKMTFRG